MMCGSEFKLKLAHPRFKYDAFCAYFVISLEVIFLIKRNYIRYAAYRMLFFDKTFPDIYQNSTFGKTIF